jgi:hypothetical protein
MASVVLTGDTSGSITLSAPSVAGSNTITLPASTGTVALNPSGVAGMTLLGTITPTAVNSVSLSGLTLTNYKALFIAWVSMGTSSATKFAVFISSTNVQSGGGIGLANTSAQNGNAWLDLTAGTIGGGTYGSSIASSPTGNVVGGVTNVTTSSTTIYFRQDSTSNFTATGNIYIYGVA